jgi:cytosolic phospholipase A2
VLIHVIQTENWLSVADGYVRQRGIKGWPIGAGWPKESDSTEKTAGQLDEAHAATAAEADDKVEEAKAEQKEHLGVLAGQNDTESKYRQEKPIKEDPGDLGYCTVWVGTTQEREHTDTSTGPPSKAVADDWQLMEPDAGITVIYFPFLSNPNVENVDPVTAPYMSTWNFIYTPEDIDNVVRLARANFEEGRERTRRTIRAVYERKKRLREEREGAERRERFQRKLRFGIIGKNGDHFS